MARYVKVAALGMMPADIETKPEGMSILDFELEHLKKNIAKVLPDKPDLIILPEACDRPMAQTFTPEGIMKYYLEERGDKVLDYLKQVAIDNNCYVAYAAWRQAEDGYGRNACKMIDRKGNVIGTYDKNHLTPREFDLYNIIPGEKETVFECDFGRVGCIICFDMNFEEIREKYKKADVDMIIFPSNYHGGLNRYFFALDTRAYLVSASSYHCPPDVVNPVGSTVSESTIYYDYLVDTINLDYMVCHLDGNKPKIEAAKQKYGEKFKIFDPNYLAAVLISYEGTDKTVKDIAKEFDIISYDEYLDIAREERDRALKLRK